MISPRTRHFLRVALLLVGVLVFAGLTLLLAGCAVDSVSLGGGRTEAGDLSGELTIHLRAPRGLAK